MSTIFFDDFNLNNRWTTFFKYYCQYNFQTLKSNFSGTVLADNHTIPFTIIDGLKHFDTIAKKLYIYHNGEKLTLFEQQEETLPPKYRLLGSLNWTDFNFNMVISNSFNSVTQTNNDIVLPEELVFDPNDLSASNTRKFKVKLEILIPDFFEHPEDNFGGDDIAFLGIGFKSSLSGDLNQENILNLNWSQSIYKQIGQFFPRTSDLVNSYFNNSSSLTSNNTLPFFIFDSFLLEEEGTRGYGTYYLKGKLDLDLIFYPDGSFTFVGESKLHLRHFVDRATRAYNRDILINGMGTFASAYNSNVATTLRRMVFGGFKVNADATDSVAGNIKAQLFEIN